MQDIVLMQLPGRSHERSRRGGNSVRERCQLQQQHDTASQQHARSAPGHFLLLITNMSSTRPSSKGAKAAAKQAANDAAAAAAAPTSTSDQEANDNEHNSQGEHEDEDDDEQADIDPPLTQPSKKQRLAPGAAKLFAVTQKQMEQLSNAAAAKVSRQQAGATQGNEHNNTFTTVLSTLKRSTSKQFAKQMYLLQHMIDEKASPSEIHKVVKIFFDWIVQVETDKGKTDRASDEMKDQMLRQFPEGKSKDGTPVTVDGGEMWSIVKQAVSLSCPHPEHWTSENHNLDTCCFNTRTSDARKSDRESSSSSSYNQSSYGSRGGYYGKRRFGNDYQSNPMAAAAPNTMMPVGPPMWPGPPAMPQPYGYNPMTPTPGFFNSPGGFPQQSGYGGGPSQYPRTPCGFLTPNGPCPATNHRPHNCPHNPNKVQSTVSAQTTSAPETQSTVAALPTRIKDVEMSDEDLIVYTAASDPEADSRRPSVFASDIDVRTSKSETNAGVSVLREHSASSSSLRTETNQLPTTLESPADDSIPPPPPPHRDPDVQSETLIDLYLDVNEEVLNSEASILEENSSVDIQQSNTSIPAAHDVLPFGGSLTKLMQRKFSGRKGKKILDDEQLNSLRCEYCSTRGHTRDCCINLPAREDRAEQAWLKVLLAKPAFHLERLTLEKNWEEIQQIIEVEGTKHNEGNPWRESTKRRDMLRRNLGYWYVIGAGTTVLSWLGYGVPMRFLTEPERFRFRNHDRTMEGHTEFVRAEHKLRVEDGSFVQVDRVKDRDQIRIINPIMIAMNKKKKPRMCHDMRWPNGYLPHVEFRMETLAKELPDVVAPGDDLLSIDIATAYYSVPLHPDAQMYLCWEYEGVIYKPTILVFGVSPAPHVFTKIMRPWMQLCRSVRVKLMGMIDDYLFSTIRSQAPALAIFIRYSLTRLGWQLNEKCQLTPQPRLCILGMIVDASKMIVEAPVEKVRDALALVKKVLWLDSQQKWIDVSILQQLCGKLQSMVLALPGVRVFTRSLYVLIAKALDEQRTPRFKITLDEFSSSIQELAFWQERLQPKYNGLPIHIRDATVKMWVDAGDIGWGGEVRGEAYHGELPIEEIANSSTRRELVGLLKMSQAALHHIKDERIIVHMDSYPAVCNLVSGGGSKSGLVEAIKDWFRFCELNNIITTYEWIPREQNTTADRYSKMAAVQYPLCDGVESAIRSWAFTQCQSDLRANTIAVFIPNFSVIPLRIEAVIMNMHEAIIVTPQWSSQSWWPTLLKHRLHAMYLGGIEKVLKGEMAWTRGWKMEAHWLKGRRKAAPNLQ